MDEVASLQKKIILRVVLTALTLAGFAALFGRTAVVFGVLAGSFLGILNFRLLALTVINGLDLATPRAAQVQAVVRYIIRYAFMIGFLYWVSINPKLNIFSAVVGLLLTKLVILGEGVINYIKQQVQQVLNPARWERGEK